MPLPEVFGHPVPLLVAVAGTLGQIAACAACNAVGNRSSDVPYVVIFAVYTVPAIADIAPEVFSPDNLCPAVMASSRVDDLKEVFISDRPRMQSKTLAVGMHRSRAGDIVKRLVGAFAIAFPVMFDGTVTTRCAGTL